MKRVYFDHIAGTPLHPQVLEAMLPYLKDRFGNPQSVYREGQEALDAVETARGQVAHLINADIGEILFTSCGSESNNLALKGLALAHQKKGRHIIVSAVEHQSILNAAKKLGRAGFAVTEIPVDRYGRIDPEDIRKAIRPETVLVSVMLANGEVGTIQPVAAVAGICREKSILIHTDAVDAVGDIPVDVKNLGVDALSLAANQFYGPKGIGALFIRKGVRIQPQMDGGIQEGGRRAGTENVSGIVGMGKAAEIADAELENRMKKTAALRDLLIRRLPETVEHVYLTGHPVERLAYHASFCIEFIEGESMLLSLDIKGIAAASGSTCSSKNLKASHVLLAMGIDHALAQGSVVFTLTEDVTQEDVDYLIEVFPPIINRLRQMSPLYAKYLEDKKDVQ